METLIEKEHKRLIKLFHTLIGKVGGGNVRKEAILCRLGVKHTNELSIEQLIEECNTLEEDLNPKLAELDRWRKRLIASITGYHKAMGVNVFQKNYEECSYYEQAQRIRYAKETAENAAKRKDFNKIPLEQLRSLYNGFKRTTRDVHIVNDIKFNDLLHKTSLN